MIHADKSPHCALSIGSWLQSGSPVMAEVMAGAGFSWIAADLEHSGMDWSSFSAFVRAVSAKGAKPYARVAQNALMDIRKALDCGAQGIIVPLVNNAGEAEAAVRASRYPPLGVRGFAYCQANEWGAAFNAYAQTANHAIPLIVMIESREAMENIDAILQVEGVDGVFIGPYDLSGSYGVLGQVEHPLLMQARERVVSACRTHGKMAGQHLVTPTAASVQGAIRQGYTMLALGMDTVFTQNASHAALAMLETPET